MIPFELATIFCGMQNLATRKSAALELAAFLGASEVTMFGKDAEIGVFLPAYGWPQTLPHGERWQSFLQTCAAEGSARARLPSLQHDCELDVLGMADGEGLSVIVLAGTEPGREQRQWIAALLPLIGGKLSLERTSLAIEGHAAAARDVSRRAGQLNGALDANRRELQIAYQRLEKELVCRREAESRLREADRRKDEFLAMLAHELRNPLAPISMAAQILKISDLDRATVGRTGEIIDRQVNHMTNLLNDLLDVSRVTRGIVTLEKGRVDINDVIADAVEQARPLIEAKNHRLTVESAKEIVQVEGDRTRLVQAITNLLNNAARYTAEKGEISLQLQIEPRHVAITIRDSGVGIDAALLPYIFDLFTQAERLPGRSQGGLGLGLALVKSLVELHGGKVEAGSAGLGAGSRFTIRLPRLTDSPAHLPGGEHRALLPPHRKPLCVMVVDDNADAAHMLSAFLETIGHQVHIAYNAQDALKKAGNQNLQVLLLDIGLPDMDGYQLVSHLKLMPCAKNAMLIALTGYGQEEDHARSKAAGFDHHLVKPVDTAVLAGLLANAETSLCAAERNRLQ